MAQIKISIAGMEAVLENIYLSTSQLTGKINAEIQAAGIECQALAKQACPVDTGRLRSSIAYTAGENSCTVGTNVNYAEYVEFGTRKMGAQPFLYPAYEQALHNLKDALSEDGFHMSGGM
jgi:HK97 gp10 family phage protein